VRICANLIEKAVVCALFKNYRMQSQLTRVFLKKEVHCQPNQSTHAHTQAVKQVRRFVLLRGDGGFRNHDQNRELAEVLRGGNND
jgi:hypothetical protein